MTNRVNGIRVNAFVPGYGGEPVLSLIAPNQSSHYADRILTIAEAEELSRQVQAQLARAYVIRDRMNGRADDENEGSAT